MSTKSSYDVQDSSALCSKQDPGGRDAVCGVLTSVELDLIIPPEVKAHAWELKRRLSRRRAFYAHQGHVPAENCDAIDRKSCLSPIPGRRFAPCRGLHCGDGVEQINKYL